MKFNSDKNGKNQGAMPVGDAIRTLRQEKGYSLRKLAELTGVSAATISQIEKNKTSPNLIVLKNISDALGETVVSFLAMADDESVSLVRKENRKKMVRNSLPQGDVLEEFLVRNPRFKMEPAIIILPPEGSSPEVVHHHGEEFIYVLEGKVEIILQGKGVFELNEGDTLYYSSDIPHSFKNNLKKKESRFLITATPPNF